MDSRRLKDTIRSVVARSGLQSVRSLAFTGATFALLTFGLGADGGGCSSGTQFAFMEEPIAAEREAVTCSIVDVIGTESIIKVPKNTATGRELGVIPAGDGCTVSFTLNGLPFVPAGYEDRPVTLVKNSDLAAGDNLLVASVSAPGSVSVTQSWTIRINSLPTCGTMTPDNSSTLVIEKNNTANLSVVSTDSDGDPLTMSWDVVGMTPPAGVSYLAGGMKIGSDSALGIVASKVFSAHPSLIGNRTVSVTISDSIDTKTCYWNYSVNDIAACAATNPLHPDGSTLKIKQNPTNPVVVGVTPTGPGCTTSFTINGFPAASSGNTLDLALNLNSGGGMGGLLLGKTAADPNIVVATVSNSACIATNTCPKITWKILRNSAPVCPAADFSPSNASVNSAFSGESKALSLKVTDVDNDPISYSWSVEGITGSGSRFTPSTGSSSAGSTFSSTFIPNSAMLGSRKVAFMADDGTETTSCQWDYSITETPSCAVATSFETPGNVNVPNTVGVSRLFGAVPSGTGCTTSFTLGGNPYPVPGNSPTVDLKDLVTSGALPAGARTALTATISNAYCLAAGTCPAPITWNIFRNTPPNCGTPLREITLAPYERRFNQNESFRVSPSDADGAVFPQTFTFNWKVDGVPVNVSTSTLLRTATMADWASALNFAGFVSSVTYVPATVANIGTHIISADISDGLDTVSCPFSVIVKDVPNCSNLARITELDSNGNVRIPRLTDPSQQVGLVPGGEGCTVKFAVQQGAGAAIPFSMPSNAPVISLKDIQTLVPTISPSQDYTISAYAQNGIGTNSPTLTWPVKRNTVPDCPAVFPSALPIAPIKFTDSPQLFKATLSDADGDTINYSWEILGLSSPGSILGGGAAGTGPIAGTSTNGTELTLKLTPSYTLGASQRELRVKLWDSLDSNTSCKWNLTFVDSQQADVKSCTADANRPVRTISGVNYSSFRDDDADSATMNLRVIAEGNGMRYTMWWNTPTSPASPTPLSGCDNANDCAFTITKAALKSAIGASYGKATLYVKATDQYGNSDTCTDPFYLRINKKPVFTAAATASPLPDNTMPIAGKAIRMNYGATKKFTIAVSDPDTDGGALAAADLTYSWTYDGAGSTRITPLSPASSANLTPSTGNESVDDLNDLIRNHEVKVTVSDGADTISQTYSVDVNYFSEACNNLSRGQICTYAGSTSIGSGENPETASQKFKLQPRAIAFDRVEDPDSPGTLLGYNLFIADSNHAAVSSVREGNQIIWYWNRTNKAISRLGKVRPAKTMTVVAGTGAASQSATPVGVNQSGDSASDYGLFQPAAMFFDDQTPIQGSTYRTLFIALEGDHRVIAINDSGTVRWAIGDGTTGGANQCPATSVNATNGLTCGTPTGLLPEYNGSPTGQKLSAIYVVCRTQQVVRKIDVAGLSGSNTTYTANGSASVVAGVCNQAGWQDGVAATSARLNNPRWLEKDGLGNIYISEDTSSRIRVLNTHASRTYSLDTLNTGNSIRGNLNGTVNVTNLMGTDGLWVGMPITGPNIPAGTTIAGLGTNSLTLSQAATGTATASPLYPVNQVGPGQLKTFFGSGYLSAFHGTVSNASNNITGIAPASVLNGLVPGSQIVGTGMSSTTHFVTAHNGSNQVSFGNGSNVFANSNATGSLAVRPYFVGGAVGTPVIRIPQATSGWVAQTLTAWTSQTNSTALNIFAGPSNAATVSSMVDATTFTLNKAATLTGHQMLTLPPSTGLTVASVAANNQLTVTGTGLADTWMARITPGMSLFATGTTTALTGGTNGNTIITGVTKIATDNWRITISPAANQTVANFTITPGFYGFVTNGSTTLKMPTTRGLVVGMELNDNAWIINSIDSEFQLTMTSNMNANIFVGYYASFANNRAGLDNFTGSLGAQMSSNHNIFALEGAVSTPSDLSTHGLPARLITGEYNGSRLRMWNRDSSPFSLNNGALTAASNTIRTIAGTYGSNSFNGDSKFATVSRIGPACLGLDPESGRNQLVVCDTKNNRLRKISYQDLTTTSSSNLTDTLAGSGLLRTGFMADTMRPANDMIITDPQGLYYDGEYNLLYFLEAATALNSPTAVYDGRIRRVNRYGELVSFVGRTGGTVGGADASADEAVPTSVTMAIPINAWGPSALGLVPVASPRPSPSPSAQVMIYTDSYNHSLRGWNISDKQVTAYDVSFSPDLVSTVAGTVGAAATTANILAGTATAGGSGLTTSLHYPDGLAVDADGDLIISDAWAQCVRVLTKSTGVMDLGLGTPGQKAVGQCVTTGVAATAVPALNQDLDDFDPDAVRLNFPSGVAIDPTDGKSVFIADRGNNRILYWNRSSSGKAYGSLKNVGAGKVLMVAGAISGSPSTANTNTPARGSAVSSPYGVTAKAISSSVIGMFCYANAGYQNIRCVYPTSGGDRRVWTVAGSDMTTTRRGGPFSTTSEGGQATSSYLNGARGVFLDPSTNPGQTIGDLYISDTINGIIRKVSLPALP